MTLTCSRQARAQLHVAVKTWDGDFARQLQTCPLSGTHPIFGAKVPVQDVSALPMKAGGWLLRFRFGTAPPLTEPTLFSDFDAYPRSCLANFAGNREGFSDAGRIALRNCIN